MIAFLAIWPCMLPSRSSCLKFEPPEVNPFWGITEHFLSIARSPPGRLAINQGPLTSPLPFAASRGGHNNLVIKKGGLGLPYPSPAMH